MPLIIRVQTVSEQFFILFVVRVQTGFVPKVNNLNAEFFRDRFFRFYLLGKGFAVLGFSSLAPRIVFADPVKRRY